VGNIFYAHPTQPSLLTTVETSSGTQISYSYEIDIWTGTGKKLQLNTAGIGR
jgi:hypothetical protein